MEDGVDGGFGAIGRELRQTVGAEVRADAEETERLVALAARRRRSLADVARDLLARGDTVTVGVTDRRFTGVIEHAAGDLVRLRTTAGPVDVHLDPPASLEVVERARSGGAAPGPGPATFKARLLELELAGATVELGDALGGGTVVGRLSAVAVDHVVLVDADGRERFLPLRALTFVRPR